MPNQSVGFCAAIMLPGAAIAAGPTVDDCIAAFARDVPECTSWHFYISNEGTDYEAYRCSCSKCADGYYTVGSSISRAPWYLHSECAKSTSESGSGSGSGSGTGGGISCPTGYSKCTAGQCHGPSVTIDGVIYCGNLESGVSVCTSRPSYVTSAYFMSPCCKDGAYTALNSLASCKFMACASGMTMNEAHTTCLCNKGYYGTAMAGCTECPSSGGVKGTTNSVGTEKITGCFIPSGSQASDSTGLYKYQTDCYYAE
ncbi:MAG: hypothetical protein K2I81_01680 [Alphaproteobacteria bacterium]|nr:hypothetical protein [Alphaproteobacteria bacterium]